MEFHRLCPLDLTGSKHIPTGAAEGALSSLRAHPTRMRQFGSPLTKPQGQRPSPGGWTCSSQGIVPLLFYSLFWCHSTKGSAWLVPSPHSLPRGPGGDGSGRQGAELSEAVWGLLGRSREAASAYPQADRGRKGWRIPAGQFGLGGLCTYPTCLPLVPRTSLYTSISVQHPHS